MRSFLLVLLVAPLCASAVENTPEQAVSALWRALSNDPGENADIVTLKRLFHEDAVIFGGGYKEGTPTVRRSIAKDFLKPYEHAGKKGFYECEISRAIRTYDRFAVAYSVVESRTEKAATAPDFIGVNSIQLYKVGSQWKILSLYYQVEKQGLPIPLDGGRSGKCIA
ncbi:MULTISPECIES: nuclear transport factor 2 family protein [unclassified Pseudoxanthomonas]|uniref:nuclear transport factor 2 family protein n=1 Tax=unclassified Pseudoxanthomonas TaxID=2645906 RepID=UPI003078852B